MTLLAVDMINPEELLVHRTVKMPACNGFALFSMRMPNLETVGRVAAGESRKE